MNQDNYLAHYGRDGQKKGVRHGPPYPLPDGAFEGKPLKEQKKEARKYTRTLNKLDQKRMEHFRNKKISEYEARKARRLSDSYKQAGKDKKAEKYKEKEARNLAKAKEINKSINKYQKQIDSALKEAKKKGYTINERTILADTAKTRRLVTGLLGGSVGRALYSTIISSREGHSDLKWVDKNGKYHWYETTQYKVKAK